MHAPRLLHHKTRLATLLAALLATATAASLAQDGLASSGTTVLQATLTARYLHTTSPGSGTATITITAGKVCWKFSYRGLDTQSDSGIHVAPPPPAAAVKPRLLTSYAQITRARKADQVTIAKTTLVVNCPVV